MLMSLTPLVDTDFLLGKKLTIVDCINLTTINKYYNKWARDLIDNLLKKYGSYNLNSQSKYYKYLFRYALDINDKKMIDRLMKSILNCKKNIFITDKYPDNYLRLDDALCVAGEFNNTKLINLGLLLFSCIGHDINIKHPNNNGRGYHQVNYYNQYEVITALKIHVVRGAIKYGHFNLFKNLYKEFSSRAGYRHIDNYIMEQTGKAIFNNKSKLKTVREEYYKIINVIKLTNDNLVYLLNGAYKSGSLEAIKKLNTDLNLVSLLNSSHIGKFLSMKNNYCLSEILKIIEYLEKLTKSKSNLILYLRCSIDSGNFEVIKYYVDKCKDINISGGFAMNSYSLNYKSLLYILDNLKLSQRDLSSLLSSAIESKKLDLINLLIERSAIIDNEVSSAIYSKNDKNINLLISNILINNYINNQ